MKDIAVLQRRFWHRGALSVAVTLFAAAVLLAGLVGSASAAKVVGKDGKVYACYAVKGGKGKAKGSVRLVSKGMHCKRGERKVNWSVSGPAGAAGQNGPAGTPGAPGPAGASGLEKQVSELTTRVESLEATLAGVTNSALTGALADVNALCGQTEELTAQANGIVGSLQDTTLDGLIPMGLELLVPNLPAELAPFSC